MNKQGGKREGAGRKPSGKKNIQFWCFPTHKLAIKELIKDYEKEQIKK